MKFRDLFTFTAIILAISFIGKLLESVFSKDDSVVVRDTKDMLLNSKDKDKILRAAVKSRLNDGASQNVILSTNKTLEVST